MRIGCCIPGGSFMPQDTSVTVSDLQRLRWGYRAILDAGFDFVESTVGLVMSLTEAELASAAREIRLEACNCFVPGEGTIIRGGDSLRIYVFEVMRRLRMLGCSLVVLGSGQARRIPDDLPREVGMTKIREFLAICQEAGTQYDVTVALEPLNRRESNVLNTVAEADTLSKACDLSHICVLADAFHMAVENEPLEDLLLPGARLRHIHIAEPDRSWPGKSGAYLPAFAEMLRVSGYSGGVSVECIFTDFMDECPKAAAYARSLFSDQSSNNEV